MIEVKAIELDPRVQFRDGLDEERVAGIIEFEEQGGSLPPITVVGEGNLLADGHHRLEAAFRTGKREISANRVSGGINEAIGYAVRMNDVATAKPLSRAQRNKAVHALIDAGLTDRAIAKLTGLSVAQVFNIEQQREAATEAPEVSVVEHGKKVEPGTIAPTTLGRIASAVPKGQRGDVVREVVRRNVSEPRVREAIKKAKSESRPLIEVIEEIPLAETPPPLVWQKTPRDAAIWAQSRIRSLLDARLDYNGSDLTFDQVISTIAEARDAEELADLTGEPLADQIARELDRLTAMASALRGGRAHHFEPLSSQSRELLHALTEPDAPVIRKAGSN